MLGNNISKYRKQLGLTQEQLAQKLEVTNQAVSKWENDQCCPDVQLLPKLADTLGISLDVLFGREGQKEESKAAEGLPWKDDRDFHIVVYAGHTLLGHSDPKPDITFTYEGPVNNVNCDLNLSCGDVEGNINAGGSVECGDVAGHVSAGDYVECGDVAGNLSAGGYVECGDVEGSVSAGTYVECGDVGNNVNAGSYVECGDVGGNIFSGGPVEHSGDDGDGTVRITIQKDGKAGFDGKKFSSDFFKNFWKDE